MRLIAQVLVGLGILASLPKVAAEEVWVGTWKLSIDKSPPAAGRSRSQTVTMKSEDGVALFDEENVTAKGESYRVTFRLGLDGKDYPVTGSRAGFELISGRQIDPATVELKMKRRDGTVVATYWVTHSADGKTRLTLAWAGPEVTGPPVRVAIHERQ